RTLTLSGSGTPFVVTAHGIFTASTSTVNFTGGSATNIPGLTYNNIGIGGGSTVTYTSLATMNIGGAATLAANATMSMGFGHTFNMNTTTCSLTLDNSSTISGTANLYWNCTSNTFPTNGTINLSAPGTIQFVMNADFSLPARDFAGTATVLFLATGVDHTVTLGAGTLSMGGNFQLYNSSFGDIILNASANTVITAASDFSFVKSSTGDNFITSGTGTWTFGGSVNFTNGTFTATAGHTLTMTGASKTLTPAGNALSNFILNGGSTTMSGATTVNNDLTLTAGTLTAPSATTLSVGGQFTNNAAFTHNSGTVVMTGTTKNITGSSATTFNSLTISGTTSVATSSPTVNTLLTVDVSKSLTIGSGLTVTLANTGVGALSLSGTINGPGKLIYRSSDVFPTGGTLAAGLVLRYDMSVNNMTTAVRTDYATIEAYNASGAGRTLTLGNGTHTLSGNLDLQSNAASSTLVLEGGTNNPAVNVTGNVASSVATAAVTLSMGSNTWTVGGNFDLTNITTFNNNSGTLVMNGTGTLTSNSKTLFSVTLSGTITLANATHTINGNLSFAGGTITAGTSTITMNGTAGKTITGGGATIYALNIDPSSAATVTLQTSDLIVANQLTVATGDTLALSSATLTNTFSTNASIVGTLSSAGTGKLIFPNGAGGPGTTGTLTARVRYDATNGGIATTTIDARNYRGGIELYSTSASNQTITFPTGSFTCTGTAGGFFMYAEGAGDLIADMTTSSPNPSMSTCGAIDFLGSGGGTEILNQGTGNLIAGFGSVDFTGGTYTSNGTLALNSASGSQTLTTAGNTLKNLTSNSLDLTLASETITISGNLDFSGIGNSFTPGTSTIVMTGTSNTMNSGGWPFYNVTIDPASAGTITELTGFSVTHDLVVSANDTFSFGSGVVVTVSSTTGSLTLNGTISGAGDLWYESAVAFPTSGTVSTNVWFVSDSGTDLIASARPYGADVIVDHGSGSNWKTVFGTAGGQTLDISGNLILGVDGTGNNTIDAAAWDPNINVTGNVIKRADTGSGVRTILAGTGTWTVSGDVDLTGIVYTTETNNLLKMGGTSKTLTSNGNALHHFEITGGSTTMSGTTTLNGNITLTSGTLTAPATLNVNGNWSNAGGVFVEGTNTVNLVGTSSVTMNSGCVTIATCADNEFYNLIINKTDAADANDNVTLSSNGLKVTNTLTITDGELIQGTLDVWATGGTTAVSIASAGKWTNISSGDLKLGGPFTSAGIVVFASGNSAQCTDVADDIVITSTVGGTQRLWSGGGTFTIRNVNATDMTDSSITAYTSTLSNTSWSVGSCGITFSGTVFTSANEGTAFDCTTSSGAQLDLVVAVNGDVTPDTGACTSNLGTFSFTATDPGGADVPIALYVAGTESEKGTLVTLSANGATDITGVSLFLDRLTVSQQSGTAITNSHLNTADNGNAGIRYAISAGALTVESGMELHILSGKTFTPGGTVTTTATGTAAGPAGDLHIAGTMTMGTNALTVGGDYNNVGTFNKTNPQATTLAATSTGFTITPGTGDLNNLTVSGDAGGNGTYTLSGANLTVDGTLTVNTGDTLTIDTSRTLTNTGATDVNNDGTINGVGTLQFTSASGGPDSDVNSTGTYTAVTRYNATGGDIPSTTFDGRTYSGRVELYQDNTTASNRTVTPATDGTYSLSGSSSHLYLINDDAAQTLTLAGATASAVFSIGGDLDFTGTGGSSEIIQSGNDTWTVSGNVTTTDGTYTATSGNTLIMNGNGTTLASSTLFYNLTISGNAVATATSNPTVANTLTVSGSQQLTIGSGRTVTISSSGTVSLSGTIAGPGSLYYFNNAAFPSGGTISAPLIYAPVSGTVTITSRTYGGDVTCQDTGIIGTTCRLTGTPVFNGSLSVVDGGTGVTLDGATNNPTTVTVAGSVSGLYNLGGLALSMGTGTWTVSGNFDLTDFTSFSHNSGTLIMNGTGTLTTNAKTLNNFTTSGSVTVTLASGATHTFAGNVNFGSTGLTAGTSTVVMSGSTKTLDGGSKSLYNLTI
ncbi:MAG: hypothetical protein HY975_03350, partial [Candidatus Kerfeldbacteria bacterium]|nr:hypothetical protein [Candidatus Kerfeldbacteria bacterium]